MCYRWPGLESLPERPIPQGDDSTSISAKFRQSFSHSRQPDAAKFRKNIFGNSFSVIADRQLNASFALHNLNIDDLS